MFIKDYEIDFTGVGDKVKKDYDAICFRVRPTSEDTFRNYVFDGGFEENGDGLSAILNEHYFDDCENNKDKKEKVIDGVFVSHPDEDHVAGLKTILENFEVKKLYLNCPWEFADELLKISGNSKLSSEEIKKKLRESYSFISELEELAIKNDVPVFSCFQGMKIEPGLVVLSPSKDFFLMNIANSDKNDFLNAKINKKDNFITSAVKAFKNYVYSLRESWFHELLREDVATTNENETSLILLGRSEREGFLLTGDAGVHALKEAIDFSESEGIDLQGGTTFSQIPHHGGRRNVSPSILNSLIGPIKEKESTGDKIAFVSTAKNSDHPLRMVKNAYIRRGVKVHSSNGRNIRHTHGNVPDRKGWSKIEPEKFSENVEDWED